jgi:hypothetical protein
MKMREKDESWKSGMRIFLVAPNTFEDKSLKCDSEIKSEDIENEIHF